MMEARSDGALRAHLQVTAACEYHSVWKTLTRNVEIHVVRFARGNPVKRYKISHPLPGYRKCQRLIAAGDPAGIRYRPVGQDWLRSLHQNHRSGNNCHAV